MFTLSQIHETQKNPHIFIISTIASLTFTLWFIIKLFKKPASSKNLPPSPRKLPILGNLHQLGSLPHHALHALAKRHGPLMLLHFGSRSTIIASSADMAREIMKTHDLACSDRPQSRTSRRLLYGCKDVSVALYGEYWRQLKSICVLQLLNNKRVQSFHSIRGEETAVLVDKIGESDVAVNLSDMFNELTNNVICRSAFGKKYGEGKKGNTFPALLRELMELLGSFTVGDIVPWLWWINRVNGFDARVDRVAKELDNFLEGVIRERLGSPTDEAAKDKDGENFLDILLEIYQNNTAGVSIDRDSIKAVILDVFSGSTDTTSTVLEWTMTELLRSPSILKRLQAEVRGIVKDIRAITDDDLEKMHYLKAIIKETLRYHTPNPLLVPRVAREDVNIKGYDISKGTMIMINAWAIGREPANWDEPEEFRPERFLNSSIDFKGLDFGLIPFGAGRRGCPGITFAMATIELVLANLVHKFDWGLPDEAKGKDLDMTERPGVAIRRAVPLQAIASKWYMQLAN